MGNRAFLADKTVGRLGKWLRLIGFDCIFFAESDAHLALAQARSTGRILLTKNTRVAALARDDEYVLIASDSVREQLKQVIKKYNLTIECENLFSLCSVCNRKLEDLASDQVRGLAPAFVLATRRTFRRCPECGRIYWAGTHKTRMLAWLQETLDNTDTSGTN